MVRTREQFLEERKRGIGGSDIAAIIGISPWRTPRDVWADKTGKTGDKEETQAMYWGNVLEDVVAKEFSKRTGMRVQRCNFQLYSEEYPHFCANIDRVVFSDNHKSPVGKGHKILSGILLECKTASAYAASEWGADGSTDIPEYYLSQVQWYMGVTGAHTCFVSVLIGSNDFRMYEIKRDDEIIRFLFQKGLEFWNSYVLTDVMPPAMTFEDTEKTFFHANEKDSKKYASDEVIQAVAEYRSLNTQVSELEKKMDALKMNICEFLGNDVQLLDTENKKLCSWSAAGIRTVIDWKAIAEECKANEETIQKHTSSKPSARRFTLASNKNQKEQ